MLTWRLALANAVLGWRRGSWPCSDSALQGPALLHDLHGHQHVGIIIAAHGFDGAGIKGPR